MTENTPKALVAEFIGTFCFFFIGAGAIITDAFIVSRGGHDGPGLVAIALAGLVAIARPGARHHGNRVRPHFRRALQSGRDRSGFRGPSDRYSTRCALHYRPTGCSRAGGICPARSLSHRCLAICQSRNAGGGSRHIVRYRRAHRSDPYVHSGDRGIWHCHGPRALPRWAALQSALPFRLTF